MDQSFTGTIEFDADVEIFHGSVVGFRDDVTFEGTSLTELQRALHESVDDYLAFCLSGGEDANIRLIEVRNNLHGILPS